MYQGIYFLSSDAAHTLISFCIWFFIALTSLQFIVLVLQKLLLERADRHRRELREKYHTLLQSGGDTSLYAIAPPAKKMEYETFSDAAVSLLAKADREQQESIRTIVRQYMVPPYLITCFSTSRFWTAKYQALEQLGFMKLPELRDFYRSSLDARPESTYVVSKLIWALSLVCQEDDIELIAKRLDAYGFMSAKFNEYIFCNIIESFRERGQAASLAAHLDQLVRDDTLPLLIKRDIVQACGAAAFQEAEQLILDALKTHGKSAEFRIAGIRALQGTGSRILDRIVAAGLKDQDWRVRVAAAKDISKCSPAVIPLLADVLGDEHYNVRLNAALSLSRAGQRGTALLQAQSSSSDRFIRDISKYVLSA